MARTYLGVAEQDAHGETDEGRNVAAGNAVLAAIAAALLRSIRPDGTRLSRDLVTVLGIKDVPHYSTVFVSATVLKTTPAGRLPARRRSGNRLRQRRNLSAPTGRGAARSAAAATVRRDR